MMIDVFSWYGALAAPLKFLVWILLIGLGLLIFKKLIKLAILVTIVLILIFVLRAVTMQLP